MSKKAEGFSLRFVLINTGNISRKVLSKVLRSFDKNFERLQYTTTEKAHVPENQQLVVHEATVDGQALNRYTWREKLDAVSVLEIDSFIAIVAAMIYAVLEQWKRKEKKNNEVG